MTAYKRLIIKLSEMSYEVLEYLLSLLCFADKLWFPHFFYLQQWGTHARTWWIYDANHQCPFKSAPRLCIYLRGMHKPIYHPLGKSIMVSSTIYMYVYYFW